MDLQEKLALVYDKLQKAIELELTTIPPYLMAMYSIKANTNKQVSNIIRSVFMEEMLHMVLAANILTAIGGKVQLGVNNIPSYPCRLMFNGKQFKNRAFDINLAPLAKETLFTFMQIELPEFMSEPPIKALEKIVVSGYTIGEFYNGIKDDLTNLCKAFGEENIFTVGVANQVSEQYYWRGGGQLIAIKNLKDAQEAINVIVEQGEGTSTSLGDGDEKYFKQGNDIPHYFRFNEIYVEQYYKESDNPLLPPTGDALLVDYNNVYPIKPNCKSADYDNQPELKNLNESFNANYSLMLSQIEEGFNGNPKAFYTAIMNGMHSLTPIALSMVQIPIANDPLGRHGAPSFEWQL